MNHASLFSGIGGPEIAAAMLGWDNVFHCEINDFGRKILEYWFPNSTSYEDIKTTDFKQWRGKVDVLTGGFPCQPFSYAGQRRGADDDRYLWPQMLRAIDEIRPAWVVGENVAGIVSMVEQGEVSHLASQATLFDEGDGVQRYRQEQTFTIERVCRDLEGLGYSVQPILVPACAVGAPHRRDRVFIVAHSESDGDSGRPSKVCGEERRQTQLNAEHCINGGFRPSADTSDVQLNGSEFGRRGDDIGQTLPEFGSGYCEATEGRPTTDTSEQQGERMRPQQPEYRREGQEQPRGRDSKDDGQRNVADTSRHVGDTDWAWAELSEESRVSAQCDTEPWRIHAGIRQGDRPVGERWQNFPTVSPIHRGNDGLPFNVDDLAIPFSKWRTESLKAYGNAIVPQVMYEIFRAIQMIENQ